ncbi:vacuolar protein sorting-associated protein 18 homolog isoform X1 [Clytia hemisphaerica]|uniref:Vacuolar protein sorting-associated protein 18 homolog n=1 Tax=Clytia hemisphaerica TaxID=252671 RepID=A0A7M5WLX6_9CNID
MADLMDQYADIEVNASSTNPFLTNETEEMIKTGFVPLQSPDTETPIFKRERFSFRPNSKIVDIDVSNNLMFIGLESNHVKRIDILHPNETDTIEVSKKSGDSIRKLHLDPSGNHLLIAMKSGEVFYLGSSNKKARSLEKLKNLEMECVGWNKISATEISTGQILLGSRKGVIYETDINSEEKFFLSMGSDSPKQIFNVNVGREKEESITEIHIERFQNFEKRYAVFVCTKSRFYQFVGDASNEVPMFQTVLNVFSPNPTPYLELPGDLSESDFGLFFPRAKGLPKFFGWLTGPGVYFGQLDFSRSSLKQNVTTDSRLLKPTEIQRDVPLSIGITEFHCILLYENRFEAVCTLNDEEDYMENIPPRLGTMIGLRYDIHRKSMWAFTESYIFQYKINNETRDVWKLYLDRGDFEQAKLYCKNNPAQMDLVLRKQADAYFLDKKFQQAAATYALTQISFEEVSLKFLQAKDTEALKIFLQKKMINLKNNDKTQLMMLVTWVMELYLNQLGEHRDNGFDGGYENLQDEFRKFLNQNRVKNILEQNTHVAYELLSSHADTENMIFFAMLVHDYPRVIRHYIQQEDYKGALEVLKKEQTEYQSLFEQFSPTLIQHIPKQLVELWKQRNLEPRRMIPSLVTQTESNNDESIRCAIDYLEHCVYKLKNEETAIHNYLVSLYCKIAEERPLLQYLNSQGQDDQSVCYDLKYALRLCSENGKDQATVQIYCTMNLYEEAVDLALKVDIEKAKLYADKPEYDRALKKKLWLKVARHVVEQKQDVGKAMELLKECPLLKIEDVLPFFPDFVTIDHFKDAICESLQEYNHHIDQLKSDMQEATESAKVVRAEIHDIRNRYGAIDSQAKCSLCGFPLVTRAFYFFPCSHTFHADCLIEKVKENMTNNKRNRVEELVNTLRDLDMTSNNQTTNSQTSLAAKNSKTNRHTLQESLDELVSSECFFCGDVMIKSLDQPLIDDLEFEKQLDNWK